MTYMNTMCADAGTSNCPCPLAETGDCLICGRLAGKQQCDCSWAGLCIYNEYIQNDSVVRNSRKEEQARILKKIRYEDDLLVLVIKVSKGFALSAAEPGSFVFLKGMGKGSCFDTPVSVMRVDVEKECLYVALKVISAKTKAIADAEERICLRGVYRNGLLGGGLNGLAEDLRQKGGRGSVSGKVLDAGKAKWLILTKGIGFAPAVNLLCWADGRVDTDLIIDTEKVNAEIVNDQLRDCRGLQEGSVYIGFEPLHSVLNHRRKYRQDNYDKVVILASDYYIKTIVEALDVPAHKLICSNNFHMCCGEGICGACGHIDADGNVSKMCKCRQLNVKELL